MAERLKAHAWKACIGETLSRVRIPLSPPFRWESEDRFRASVPANGTPLSWFCEACASSRHRWRRGRFADRRGLVSVAREASGGGNSRSYRSRFHFSDNGDGRGYTIGERRDAGVRA